MFLTSNEAIQGLLASTAQPRCGRKHRAEAGIANAATTNPTMTTTGSNRCRCGECRNCEDNARWERIFNEKFADPDYYAATPTRNGSSLSWLR
jgi:hypothetical protein